MNREDILEMSRQENRNKDLVEESLLDKSNGIACLVALLLCCILYAAEIMIKGVTNYGLFSIYTSYTAIVQLVKAVNLKNKRNLVAGIISIVLTIIVLIAHFNNLVATSTIL